MKKNPILSELSEHKYNIQFKPVFLTISFQIKILIKTIETLVKLEFLTKLYTTST